MTPSTISLRKNFTWALLVAIALLTGGAAPVRAEPPAAASLSAVAPVFAEESMTFTRWIKSYMNRAHIVQICVVFMLLALFIIIKKFHGPQL